jgi:hypothetical protein
VKIKYGLENGKEGKAGPLKNMTKPIIAQTGVGREKA